MAKLHELLAVVGDRAHSSTAMINDAITTFTKRPDHFRGQTRSVSYFDEARSGENVTETKNVVDTVPNRLDYALGVVAEYWNALQQLEETNGLARADLIVERKTMAKDVPATFLLGLESRLKEVRALLQKMPTLAPELTWHPDAAGGDGHYVAAAQVNSKTEKAVNYKVLYDATDKHPAQIEKWNEDTPVARIEVIPRTTMISPADKAAMLTRMETMLEAVKSARQRANSVELANTHYVAQKMFDYIKG